MHSEHSGNLSSRRSGETEFYVRTYALVRLQGKQNGKTATAATEAAGAAGRQAAPAAALVTTTTIGSS